MRPIIIAGVVGVIALGVAGAIWGRGIVRSFDKPRVGEVIQKENGMLRWAFKKQHFCSQSGTCVDLVIDTRNQALMRVDDQWMQGLKATGTGDEVIREELILPVRGPASPADAASEAPPASAEEPTPVPEAE